MAAVSETAPMGNPLPGIGVGAANGHHGELLQGVFEDRNGQLHRGLVTLPLATLVSKATFTCAATRDLTVRPGDKAKAGLAARKTLQHLDVAEGGLLNIESNIPIGHGYLIPAGTVMIVPIYAVHHHASLWSDPEAFDPDRFSPQAAKARHRYAYMPFGAGPRVCIGNAFAVMEAVAILAVLLQKVRLTTIEPKPPKPVMKVTLRSNRPQRMNLILR